MILNAALAALAASAAYALPALDVPTHASSASSSSSSKPSSNRSSDRPSLSSGLPPDFPTSSTFFTPSSLPSHLASDIATESLTPGASPTLTTDFYYMIRTVAGAASSNTTSATSSTPTTSAQTMLNTTTTVSTSSAVTAVKASSAEESKPSSDSIVVVANSTSEEDPFKFLTFLAAVREARQWPQEKRVAIKSARKGPLKTRPAPQDLVHWTYDDVIKQEYATHAKDATKKNPDGSTSVESSQSKSNAAARADVLYDLGLGLGGGLPVAGAGTMVVAEAIDTAELLGTDLVEDVASRGVPALGEAEMALRGVVQHGFPESYTPEAAAEWLESVPKNALQKVAQLEPAAQNFMDGAMDAPSQFADWATRRAIHARNHGLEGRPWAKMATPSEAQAMLRSAEVPEVISKAIGGMQRGTWHFTSQTMQQMARVALEQGAQIPAETIAQLDEIVSVGSRGIARAIMEGQYSNWLSRVENLPMDAILHDTPDPAFNWRQSVRNQHPVLRELMTETFKGTRDALNGKAVDLSLARELAYKAAGTTPSVAAGVGSTAEGILDVLGRLADPFTTISKHPQPWGNPEVVSDLTNSVLNNGMTVKQLNELKGKKLETPEDVERSTGPARRMHRDPRLLKKLEALKKKQDLEEMQQNPKDESGPRRAWRRFREKMHKLKEKLKGKKKAPKPDKGKKPAKPDNARRPQATTQPPARTTAPSAQKSVRTSAASTPKKQAQTTAASDRNSVQTSAASDRNSVQASAASTQKPSQKQIVTRKPQAKTTISVSLAPTQSPNTSIKVVTVTGSSTVTKHFTATTRSHVTTAVTRTKTASVVAHPTPAPQNKVQEKQAEKEDQSEQKPPGKMGRVWWQWIRMDNSWQYAKLGEIIPK